LKRRSTAISMGDEEMGKIIPNTGYSRSRESKYTKTFTGTSRIL
jgi:hypothetical protein